MGSGNYSSLSYSAYASSRGLSTVKDVKTGNITLDSSYTVRDLYRSSRLNEALNPHKVLRECRDSDEHPCTIPVILALDVTGSMGGAAAETAKKLNDIMSHLYSQVKDVEFMTMGIGDLYSDDAPIQATQFESDIRIAEQLEKVYFEGGGGGNGSESYSAAWYFGLHNTDLDCWKRGQKGIIITLGDEPLNPDLPKRELNSVLGSSAESKVDTKKLYAEVLDKFDVYHIAVDDSQSSYRYYKKEVDESFTECLGDHYKVATLESLPGIITGIITEHCENAGVCGMNPPETATTTTLNENGEVVW